MRQLYDSFERPSRCHVTVVGVKTLIAKGRCPWRAANRKAFGQTTGLPKLPRCACAAWAIPLPWFAIAACLPRASPALQAPCASALALTNSAQPTLARGSRKWIHKL